MTDETQYILMPASVIALLKAEMVKEGVGAENAKLALIKLGYLIAQETTKGEPRAKDFESFKTDLRGKLKTEGLGQLLKVMINKSGDIQIVMERSVESTMNQKLKFKGKCNYTSGYLMGLVNAYIPTKRQYICKELACVNEGTGKNCIIDLKPSVAKRKGLEIS